MKTETHTSKAGQVINLSDKKITLSRVVTKETVLAYLLDHLTLFYLKRKGKVLKVNKGDEVIITVKKAQE